MSLYELKAEEVVLLVIDIQEKLMAAMKDKELVIKNSSILLELANQFKFPVIATEQYPKGLGNTVPEIAEKFGSAAVLEKVCFSAQCAELSHRLAKYGRKKVVVVGSETHVCVFQTVRDLLAEGYNVYVPADAVCSRFSLNQANGLDLMKGAGAIITNTETIVFDILKQAGTPEFKVMSALVK